MYFIIHKILSYCKSHIYELHAIVVAIITFFLMFPVKKPLKRLLPRRVKQRDEKDEKWNGADGPE